MKHILEGYLRRLTNLSSGNRSLLLSRLSAEQHLDLKSLDFAIEKPAFHILEQLIAGKDQITICPVLDSRSASSNEVSKQLRKISRTEQQIWEERGSKDLYVGWPIVQGKFLDDTVIRAPLVFFPVSLQEEKNLWVLKRDEHSPPQLNKSFLLSYYFFNQLPPNENLLEISLEEMDTDALVFRTQLYEVFKNEGLELHFNQENFGNELLAFQNINKEDLEAATEKGKLKLFPQAILGIFAQAGSYLVPDYLKLIEEVGEKTMEDFFQSSIPKEMTLPSSALFSQTNQVKEENILSPFAMDAFQENALKMAKKGQSLVVHGPPGTGKSQLICNLMADYASRGMRVLLVSQKRAALDVVYDRMKSLELDHFMGLVHDFKNDRKEIFSKLAGQINKLEDYQNKNNSLDAIKLERQFTQTSRRIDQITEELEEMKQALFDVGEIGMSVKEMYLNSDPNLPFINLNQIFKDIQADDIPKLISNIKSFLQYASKFRKHDHPWLDRKNLGNLDNHELYKMKELFEELPLYRKKVKDRSQVAFGNEIDIDALDRLREQKEQMSELIDVLKDQDIYQYFQLLLQNDTEPQSLWLGNTERVILDCFKPPGPEVSVPSAELGLVQEAIQKKIESKSNPRKFLFWKLFSKRKFLLNRVLVANNLSPKKADLKLLIEKIDNRLNLEHNISKLREKSWLHDVPQRLQKIDFQTWFFLQKKAIKAHHLYRDLRGLESLIKVEDIDNITFCSWLAQIQNWINEFDMQKSAWQKYFSPSQINQILMNENQRNLLKISFEKDAQEIYDFDRLLSDMPNSQIQICEQFWDYFEEKELEIEKVNPLFYNSLYLSQIEEVERRHPILKTIGTIRFDQLQEELREAIKTKQGISHEILKLKLREQTYKKLEYNRLQNRVTYRDLEHQVNKKRRIWPLRKLLYSYPGDVFSLMPCWLASPESVSALFPMREIFDLVIFDEASQCFVEKGIPAIHRAKQVVIAGDAQQLSPFDLYKVRWENEEEESPELEIDSLLDLARKHLPEVVLQGHYRSKRTELIYFSNLHFYKGGLRILPDRLSLLDPEPALEYIKTNGVWKNQTNEEEAKKVVDLVQKITSEKTGKSIGIVTFNAPQQGLIQDKLEKAGLTGKHRIFIKNIENVQGDEADIVVFSLAYAPDEKGKMNMQFGTLNARGGENRLNVAITRAKEKIIMVTSIWPEQLLVEGSKNDGPGLLKAYLEFVRDTSEGKNAMKDLQDASQNPTWYLSRQLSQADIPYKLVEEPKMPIADLVVKSDDQVLSLILTDDQYFFSSLSMKDSLAYVPEHLENNHWKHMRIYSREWWCRKEQTEEKIKKFIANSHV